jgi:hypothetical protein
MLLEDFPGALEDYDTYITKNLHDELSRAFGYAERGLAKRLLGRDKEGEADMQKAFGLARTKEQSEIVLIKVAVLSRQIELLHQTRIPKKKAIG